MFIGIKKLISLAIFYIKCIAAFFRPNVKWTRAVSVEFITRFFYYICNWCYSLMLTIAEGLIFILVKDLKDVERRLYDRYFQINQFYIALRDGLKILPKNITALTYGETSWFAMKKILDTVEAGGNDVFYDLGCGTGRNVFFTRIYYGIRSIGIDLIPTFIQIGEEVAKESGIEGVKFIENDIFKASISDGTIFLAVVTVCYNNVLIDQLKEKFKEIETGSWVISVSCPLICDHLKIVKVKSLFYSWGLAKTYFHRKI